MANNQISENVKKLFSRFNFELVEETYANKDYSSVYFKHMPEGLNSDELKIYHAGPVNDYSARVIGTVNDKVGYQKINNLDNLLDQIKEYTKETFNHAIVDVGSSIRISKSDLNLLEGFLNPKESKLTSEENLTREAILKFAKNNTLDARNIPEEQGLKFSGQESRVEAVLKLLKDKFSLHDNEIYTLFFSAGKSYLKISPEAIKKLSGINLDDLKELSSSKAIVEVPNTSPTITAVPTEQITVKTALNNFAQSLGLKLVTIQTEGSVKFYGETYLLKDLQSKIEDIIAATPKDKISSLAGNNVGISSITIKPENGRTTITIPQSVIDKLAQNPNAIKGLSPEVGG
jgi:hypothetical protein